MKNNDTILDLKTLDNNSFLTLCISKKHESKVFEIPLSYMPKIYDHFLKAKDNEFLIVQNFENSNKNIKAIRVVLLFKDNHTVSLIIKISKKTNIFGFKNEMISNIDQFDIDLKLFESIVNVARHINEHN